MAIIDENNPAYWDGKNPECCIEECENEIMQDDEHCEDHQRCIMCGDNDDCECEDEFSEVTACCESYFWGGTDICNECREHSCSAWEDAVEQADYKDNKLK